MTEEKFKLPLSSYEELVKIIITYGQISQPESLSVVSKLSGMNRTVISGNAGFLTAIGVLESGAKKFPTPPGKELAHALEHDMKDDITNCWRRIVSGNDFFEKLLTAIRIRKGMDEDTLEKHIAYSAGQPRKKQFMTGARTVVDILRAAGLITESDGKIITKVELVPAEAVNIIESMKRPQEKPVEAIRPKAEFAVQGAEVRLIIQVNIDCAPADLGELAGKLKALIKELSLNNGRDDESA